MSKYDELLKQKADIEAKIRAAQAEEINDLRSQAAAILSKLNELDALPASIKDACTDSNGYFNAARVFRKVKG